MERLEYTYTIPLPWEGRKAVFKAQMLTIPNTKEEQTTKKIVQSLLEGSNYQQQNSAIIEH